MLKKISFFEGVIGRVTEQMGQRTIYHWIKVLCYGVMKSGGGVPVIAGKVYQFGYYGRR